MQLSTYLFTLAPLLALVSAEACVAGGPTAQVTAAGKCCLIYQGTWYQFFDNQAICVLSDSKYGGYLRCTSLIPDSLLDERCIPGDGGLSPSTTSTTTARQTIT